MLTAGLVLFVVVAAVVISRRTYGFRQHAELGELGRERQQLSSERLRLEGEIREASSRARLVPIAEQRLGMRLAPDQIVDLPRDPAPAPPARR
jgi:cell division protein FtsL